MEWESKAKNVRPLVSFSPNVSWYWNSDQNICCCLFHNVHLIRIDDVQPESAVYPAANFRLLPFLSLLLRGYTTAIITLMCQARTCGQILAPCLTPSAPKHCKLLCSSFSQTGHWFRSAALHRIQLVTLRLFLRLICTPRPMKDRKIEQSDERCLGQ